MNTTICYVQWRGEIAPPHDHFNVSQYDESQSDSTSWHILPCMKRFQCHMNATKHNWMYDTVSEFLYEFVYYQQPDMVMMNTGLHQPFFDGKSNFAIKK